MSTIEKLVRTLDMQPHPEGGFFRETYRSGEMISSQALPGRFEGDRHMSTAIFFLLPSGHRSLFHRIKSDELWFWHEGSRLSIYIIEDNKCRVVKLGPDLANGELYQVTVPANSWFGSIVDEPDSYTLSSCVVAPGFDFQDFELAGRAQLLMQYPELASYIELLTNP